MKRIFFAVPLQLNNELLKFFSNIRKHFKGERIAWVKPEGMHVTIHFFGNQTDEIVNNIIQLSEKELKTITSFSLQYIKPLLFGGVCNPKVIGMELSFPKELEILKKKVDNLIQSLGLKVETRTFIPHLTFGRVKKVYNKTLYYKFLQKEIHIPEMSVKNLVLYQSFLNSKGATYKSLWTSS